MFKIGDIVIKNRVIVAPMAGVSTPSYMKICSSMGAGYLVSELISSEAVVRDNKKTFDMLNGISDIDVPFGVQLFGNDSDVMGRAAKRIVELYKPDFIDINMGCPVPKVAIKSESGSALLKDVSKVYSIVKSVVSSVSVPVTVKIRSGWDSSSINAVLVAKTIEKAGASLICIHGRTRAMGYSGEVSLDIIKSVKDAVSIPVIGNGDIRTIYDAKKMIDYTGVDGVMIGRGLLGNPWLIKECNAYLDNGEIIPKPSFREKVDMLKKHYFLLKEYNGEKSALLEIRSHALWYIKGFPDVKKYKNLITSCKSEDEFLSILEDILVLES